MRRRRVHPDHVLRLRESQGLLPGRRDDLHAVELHVRQSRRGGPGGPIGAGGVAGTGGGDYVIHLSAVTFATPPAGIPTLGEWGSIILGIGLVIAMTILIRRVM